MKKILRFFLSIAGLVIFAWFFIPGVITANFHIGVLTGAGIGLVLTLYGIFFTQLNSGIGKLWKYAVGKILILTVSLALCAIMALAGMCIYHMINACRQPEASQAQSPRPATILVLGCKVYSYGPSLSLIARMDAAIRYLEEHPDAACIVCGGQGPGEPTTEAQAMYSYMTDKGIAAERIYREDSSTDTRENLANAAHIIDKNNLPAQAVIATNDFHMYRALTYAEDAGLSDPGAVPASTLWWLFPSLSVREMYGIMEMWFLN